MLASKDPVGFLSDLSIIMTGGSSALVKLPGALGAVGKVTKAVGGAIDPLGQAGRLAIRGAKLLPSQQAKQYAQIAEEIWHPLVTIASQSGRVKNTLEEPNATH